MLQKKNSKASSQRTYNVSIILLLLVIGALLVSSCGAASSTQAPITADPEIIAKYRDRDTKPVDKYPDGTIIDDWICDGTCNLKQNGHTLTVSNVPPGVTAYYIPIPDGDKEVLASLPKEGLSCLNSINGNLVFYKNDKSKKLVTAFEKPVTLTIAYTNADLQAVDTCQTGEQTYEDLLKDLAPVYLFMPTVDVNVNIWKPFQSYTIAPEPGFKYDISNDAATKAGTITIEIMFWGDDPKGIGTPKSATGI